MDLLNFEGQELYFDEPLDETVQALIAAASESYGEGSAEAPLLEAQSLAPHSLTVLVALYRFYYYQHRLEEAIEIAEQALDITARDLALPRDWRRLSELHIAHAALTSMGSLRFHLLCLKAEAYLLLRLGREEDGKAILRKLLELDGNNRLGARQLLDVVETRLRVVG
jgi:tetratricopeptide (TPR) repeat protein